MSLDKSLRKSKGMGGFRNVLKRVERIVQLQEQDRWTEEDGAYGLPKVRVYRALSKKKKKVKKEEGEDDKKKKKKK